MNTVTQEASNAPTNAMATQHPVSSPPEPIPRARPNARLITRATDRRFPTPAVWGFPIDPVKVGKQYDAGNPEHGPDALTYVSRTLREMKKVCGEIVGEPLNKSRRRWDLGYRIQPKLDWIEVYVFAVVSSTFPDPRFVPDDEKIAELKAFFQKYGVTKEPGWYWSTM